MRFWTLLAVVCSAAVAFDQRSNNVQVITPPHPIASTSLHFKNRVLTAPGKANQVNTTRGRYERSGFKNGGRVGAFVGATAGAVAGTVAGGAAGTAIGGPAVGVVGGAFGLTTGMYVGIPLGRKAGAKIGARGGRFIDKYKARRDAKAKANAPPAPIGKKKRRRSQANGSSPQEPTETTAPKAVTGQAEKRPGFFSRRKKSAKTLLQNAVRPMPKKWSA
ncbi:unnamed protein product [Aphanomyces euteiches]|uniref:Glycine zipper domain-containing protein n=1 Tax=Aphanomyces euteiches TaxID=100861 RepID=A0A6G0W7J5_9STRA|nr:hypothetical protein Ae201684_017992 [Aphanomyces euteiches]KAH9074030.1 hypothetical protein Ae201684P_015928 [Aphanomyces euteiches]KAH9146668.1 hypothetical protein AeRB84_009478 [Aphanomyces euteiches]